MYEFLGQADAFVSLSSRAYNVFSSIFVSLATPLRLRREMLKPGALSDVSKGCAYTLVGEMFQSDLRWLMVKDVKASSSRLERPPKLLMSKATSSSDVNLTKARSLSFSSRR